MSIGNEMSVNIFRVTGKFVKYNTKIRKSTGTKIGPMMDILANQSDKEY